MASERNRRTILTAPSAGIVQQVQVTTIGAVVRPADPLLVIVPEGTRLVVEANVLNRDAGFVREGQESIKEKPRWTGKVRPRLSPPELIHRSAYLLVAPRVVALLGQYGVDQLEIVEIDWAPDSDERLCGYAMLDVRRVFQSYDYNQCEIGFHKSRGQMIGRVGSKRGFRDDIDLSVHMFRDLYDRRPIVLSRKLAHFLRGHNVRGLFVDDPASGEGAFFHEKLAAEAAQ